LLSRQKNAGSFDRKERRRKEFLTAQERTDRKRTGREVSQVLSLSCIQRGSGNFLLIGPPASRIYGLRPSSGFTEWIHTLEFFLCFAVNHSCCPNTASRIRVIGRYT
jgi:hypothetical protein